MKGTHMLHTPRALILGAVTVVALAGGATALAVSDDPRDAPPQRIEPIAQAAPTTVSPEISDAFAIFARPAATSREITPEQADRMRHAGASPALARRAEPADGGPPLFVTAGPRSSVCLVDASGGGGCTRIEDAARAGAVSTVECPPDRPAGTIVLTGLAPDGGDTVVLSGGAEPRTVAVRDNVWRAEVDVASRPAVVRYADGDELEIPYSPDVRSGSC